MQEIEKKFVVHTLPDISWGVPILYERHFIEISDTYELRIQKKGGTYEKEEKWSGPRYLNHKEKAQLTVEEYTKLKNKSIGCIERVGYSITEHPGLSLKVYHGTYEGLMRAEVEFDSIEDAEKFIPEEWMGVEITNSPLGKDKLLVQLGPDEFAALLKKYTSNITTKGK